MGVLDVTAFERSLSSLSDDDFAAFIEDVWTERGRPCRVVTTHPNDATADERTVVRTLSVRSRLLLRIRLATVGVDFDGVDAVVVTVDDERLRALARDADVAYVGPAELRDIVLYAIDRHACHRLFRTYFDEPPLPDDGGDQPARRLDAALRRIDRFPAGVTTRSRHVLAISLVVALLVLSFGGTGPPARDDPGAPPVEVPDGPFTESGSATLEPITAGDVSPLLAHHQSAVQSGGVLVTITHDDGRGEVLTRSRWNRSTHGISVSSDGSYRISVTGTLSPATVGSADRPVSVAIRGSDANCSATTDRAAGRLSPERICDRIRTEGIDAFTGTVVGSYVERYLNRTEPRIEPVHERPDAAYRVVARRPPPGLPGTPTNYTAVAVVDGNGSVSELRVRYETPLTGSDDPVAIDVTVAEPESSHQTLGTTVLGRSHTGPST